MSQTITLFEHEYTSNFNWNDSHLSALQQMHAQLNTEVLKPVVKQGKRELQAAQHVGVVRLGNRVVQILPKVYKPGSTEDRKQLVRDATRNLLFMLSYSSQFRVREHEVDPLLNKEHTDWFEILTRLFASHLSTEWQAGAVRQYQEIQEELPTLKGKWRISEQLRRPERKHIFSVAYDEFTADNRLNRILRYVVERLWHLTRDAENRQMLDTLRQWMDEEVALPTRVSAKDAESVTFNRLNDRFEPIVNLARLFLDDSTLQVASGATATYAFVFDMNQLFESFLVRFIQRFRCEILPAVLAESELLPQSRGVTMYLAEKDDGNILRIRPDLVFRIGSNYPVILDAKYKLLNKADAALGVSQIDFYQMFAYAHRYASERVILMYPQTGEKPERVHLRLKGTTKRLMVTSVDVRRYLGSGLERDALVHEMKMIFEEAVLS